MVQILDTTLRDGSYVVDFQLTAHDTALIGAALDAEGVPFIEIGHGVGMNASSNPSMRAASTDEEYLRAAAESIKHAKWGMFFIPGIGRIDDIDLASSFGMSLLRVGTNVTEVPLAEKFIARAKKRGMYVSANLMKTYAAKPEEVGRLARIVAEYGADIVCVVDSAGGMLPEDIDAYFAGIRAESSIPIGFHGHNNLGLAIANSLRAVENGAAIVDTSIRGMGRSAGNAATEIFLLALQRRGIEVGIDPLRIMTIAEQRIDPMLRNYPQVDSIGIISGYAQFHSSFLGTVLEYAARYGVDPRELILYVTREDKVNAPKELVERLAREMSELREVPRRVTVSLPRRSTAMAASLENRAREVATDARILARKYGKITIFNLVQAYRGGAGTHVSTAVADGPQFVIGSAEVATPEDGEAIVEAVAPLVEYILLDSDIKSPSSAEIISRARRRAQATAVLAYSDLAAWSRSVVAMLAERVGGELAGVHVSVIGKNQLARECASMCALMGARLVEASGTAQPNVRVVIACDEAREDGYPNSLSPDAFVIDALIGALSVEFATNCHERGIPIYRPDMRAVIHGEAAAAIGTARLVATAQGTGAVNGIPVAAGGMVAARGTIIVDSIQDPTRVFGVADGRGFLISSHELSEALRHRLSEVEASVTSTIG